MAEIIGINTILANALPTGVDGPTIAQWRLRDGSSFQDVVRLLAGGLAQKNTELVAKWGFMFNIYDQPEVIYADGGSVTEAQELTDVDMADPIVGDELGHMIGLKAYGRSTGGSKRMFRDARQTRIISSIRKVVKSIEWRFERMMLDRFFVNTETAVGGSGWNVGLVRGTGGNVDFTPPAMSGQAFANTHDHYLAHDSDNITVPQSIELQVAHLVEHGHMAPYEMIVSKTDVDNGVYHDLENFVQLIDLATLFSTDRGGVTSGSRFLATGTPDFEGIIGRYHSRYGVLNVRMSARVPAGYRGLFKSYGSNNDMNPVYCRIHPDVGFGMRLVTETTDDRQYPIKLVQAEAEFGFGIGEDRTNGVVVYYHTSGSWSNPTIT